MTSRLGFGRVHWRNTDSAVCFTPWFPRSDRSDDCLSAWCRKSFSASRKRTLNDSLQSQIPEALVLTGWVNSAKKRTRVGLGSCHAVFIGTLMCKDGKFPLLNLCWGQQHYCRGNMCVGVCVVFSCIESLFEPLSVFCFSNEGQKADRPTRSAKQAFSTARMFKVF